MVSDLTLKRVAALRELASLGIWQGRATTMLNLSNEGSAHYLAKKFGFEFPPKPRRDTPLRKAIREGYAAGERPIEIARRLGTSPGTVNVLACRMGLKSDFLPGRAPVAGGRAFAVPDHLRERYRELRRLHLTVEECGWELGLVPRPPVTPK